MTGTVIIFSLGPKAERLLWKMVKYHALPAIWLKELNKRKELDKFLKWGIHTNAVTCGGTAFGTFPVR